MLMQLKQTVNVFIVMNPPPFCIPLLSVKRPSPSLIKFLTKQTIRNIHQQWPTDFLECCIMKITKKLLLTLRQILNILSKTKFKKV